MSDWIQTFTGKKFYPLNPLPEDVDIHDIAHALSLTCRFGGHCRESYNVAQHSLLVTKRLASLKADPKTMLWGLLHDASEAYLCDLPSPVKKDDRMASYREHEKAVMAAICHKFSLPFEEPEEVRAADKYAFSLEAWSLFPREMVREWKSVMPDTGEHITPIDAQTAEHKFLAVFEKLSAA